LDDQHGVRWAGMELDRRSHVCLFQVPSLPNFESVDPFFISKRQSQFSAHCVISPLGDGFHKTSHVHLVYSSLSDK
jgi:hypothetical protein